MKGPVAASNAAEIHADAGDSATGFLPWLKAALRRVTPRWIRSALSPRYREFQAKLEETRRREAEESRLEHLPRRQRGVTDLLGKPFVFVDAYSFCYLYKQLIQNEIYRFSTAQRRPYIIDGGANVGVSVLYFKQQFPEARVCAFEPDADIFRVLEENCRTFGLGEVTLHQAALWKSDGSTSFRQEGADAGRLSSGDASAGDIVVSTKRLLPFLDEPVAFLKLDIEGAETDVLEDCAGALGNVENLFVEYHSFANRPQTLHRLLSVLHEAGFRVHVHAHGTSPQPLFSRNIRVGMDPADMNLDIFCYRN